MLKAWHTHGKTPYGGADFYPLLPGLDHGAGHLAPLRSILRLAVVDSEALAVE